MKNIDITYLGQCGFLFKYNDISLAIDPVLNDLFDETGASLRCYPPIFDPLKLSADYILCTHDHIDHMALDTLLPIAANKPFVKFLVPLGCKEILLSNGVSANSVIGLGDSETITLPGTDITVTGISTAHPIHQLNSAGQDCNLAYCVAFGSQKIVHLGDTYLTPRLEQSLLSLGAIDIFFPPINGKDALREAQGIFGNLSPQEAAHLAVTINAALTIPTHFDMIRGNTENPEKFIAALKELNPNAKYRIPAFRK